MTEQPDFEGLKEWSKRELFSLQNRIEHRRTIAHIAAFLRRTEAEVREKAAELGLKVPDQEFSDRPAPDRPLYLLRGRRLNSSRHVNITPGPARFEIGSLQWEPLIRQIELAAKPSGDFREPLGAFTIGPWPVAD